MDKSGFKPAWMKITSTADKLSENDKILNDRSLNSIETLVQGVRISHRQRHHSSTPNDQIATRYGSTFYPKSTDRQTENSSSTSSHPFQFRRSYNRKQNGDDSPNSSYVHSKTSEQRRLHSSSSVQNTDESSTSSIRRLNSESLLNNDSSTREQDFSSINDEQISTRQTFKRKERLASAPTNVDDQMKILSNPSRFQDDQLAEKEFLKEMGWTETDEEDFYQITEEDREIYEKRRQLFPKRHNRSAELLVALHRRSLPSINLQHLLQTNDDDDENSDD